jgi:purine-binding chemotaxis protein CheW
MENSERFLIFTLDDQRYALPLYAVKRVVRIIEITRLPKAPEIILGVINVAGRVIAVVDVRKRFRLPKREITLTDQLILAQTAARSIALVVDAATGVIERSGETAVTAWKIVPGMEYVAGVLKFEDGLVLIHDLEKFLSLEEEKTLEHALLKVKK